MRLDNQTAAQVLGRPPSLCELLDETVSFYRSYIVMGDAEAEELALWTISTHVFECFTHTSYQHITSAVKLSGKSNLLDCMRCLVREPLLADDISPASVYRAVEENQPTLLIDESDASFGKDADREKRSRMVGIINGGFRSSGCVIRCEPPDWKYREFQTFCPKAFAGIGGFLSDTTLSRSITIRLKRKRRDEKVEPFIERLMRPRAEKLKGRIEEWAATVDRNALADAWPLAPIELDDRAVDIWVPLLAIADLAGGVWPERARRAALALSSRVELRDESIGVRLLADIRGVFDRRGDIVFTRDLIQELCLDDEAPWARWHKGRPISPRAIGDLLHNFEIRSRSVRMGGHTAKGFRREQFQNAWSRYLPPTAPAQPSHPSQPASQAGSRPIGDPSQESSVTDPAGPPIPHENTDVTGVTLPAALVGSHDNEAARPEAFIGIEDPWSQLPPCRYPTHRSSDWTTPDGRRVCGVCHPSVGVAESPA